MTDLERGDVAALDAADPHTAAPAHDLLCFSHLRWDFVYQRPQHLLSRCARSRRVFFVEEPQPTDGPPRLEVGAREGGVRVAVPHLPESLQGEARDRAQRALLDELLRTHAIDRYVAWYYSPMALDVSRHLRPAATIYDCMDELTGFLGAPPALRERERELLGRADLVFTGGEVFSLRAANDPVIEALASGPVRSIPTDDFSHGEATGPLMPWLLNGTLKDLTHRDLRFEPDRKFLYFKPNRDGSDRKAKSGPKRFRTVVVRKRPAEGATWSEYVRHYALEQRFHLLGDRWFMSIVPTYHFTSDGLNESPFAAALLKGIKQQEGHGAIRAQTAFWAQYLSWAPNLFSNTPDERLQFGSLETADVDRGIDDKSWKPAPPEFTNRDDELAAVPTLFEAEDY